MLAHTGPGAGWQALVAMIGVGIVVVFALSAAGVVEVESLDDLRVRIVAVGMVSSFGLAAGPVVAVLSDWGGYAAVAGAVASLALLVSAATDHELRGLTPLTASAVGLAVLAAILVGPVLDRAWHPPERTAAAASRSPDSSAMATVGHASAAGGRDPADAGR